ncbi:MAG: MerR family transcriptional regulator [Alteromonadaceae bacterium]|nr:MerR family transcriptional regulator [Alteromonadaceae bacterium]
MRIGELAEKAGVRASTIRFYEKSGLMPKAERKASGYRYYDNSALERLQLIRFSTDLGFSLEELPSLLQSPDGFDHDLVMQRLQQKQQEMNAQLAQLMRKQEKMSVLIKRIESHWTHGQCMPVDELAEILKDVDH